MSADTGITRDDLRVIARIWRRAIDRRPVVPEPRDAADEGEGEAERAAP